MQFVPRSRLGHGQRYRVRRQQEHSDGAVATDAGAPDAELADALIPVDMTQPADSVPNDAGRIDGALNDRGVDDASVVSDACGRYRCHL